MVSSHRLPDPDGSDFDWESYEELVKDIYQALGRSDGVTVECWGRGCKVRVAAGVWRQVDVLLRHTDGEREYRTAISCKWWNAHVDVAHVSDFALIVQDARLSKGIIVSKMGFSKPAKALARAKSIGLVELRKPLDADWEGSITRVRGEIVCLPAANYRYNLSMTKPSSSPESNGDQEYRLPFSSTPDRLVINEPDGKTTTLKERVRQVYQQPVDGAEFDFDFPDRTTLTIPDDPEHPANGASLHRVSVQVSVPRPLTVDIDWNAADLIYMIMDSVFEGRRFHITNEGEIIDTGSSDTI